jgi:hypothetical protein
MMNQITANLSNLHHNLINLMLLNNLDNQLKLQLHQEVWVQMSNADLILIDHKILQDSQSSHKELNHLYADY